jgi:hypothetical protein
VVIIGKNNNGDDGIVCVRISILQKLQEKSLAASLTKHKYSFKQIVDLDSDWYKTRIYIF